MKNIPSIHPKNHSTSFEVPQSDLEDKELLKEYPSLVAELYNVTKEDVEIREVKYEVSTITYSEGKLNQSYIDETIEKYPMTEWLRNYKKDVFFSRGYSEENEDPGIMGWITRLLS